MSKQEKLEIHRESRMNDILNRLVELAHEETSGFSEDEIEKFVEKLMGYDDK